MSRSRVPSPAEDRAKFPAFWRETSPIICSVEFDDSPAPGRVSGQGTELDLCGRAVQGVARVLETACCGR